MASEFDTPKNTDSSEINQSDETSASRRRAVRSGLVGTVAALGLLSASPAEAGARYEAREATPPDAFALYYQRLAQLPQGLDLADPRDVLTNAVDTCNDRAGKTGYEKVTMNVNDQKLRRHHPSVTMRITREADTVSTFMNYGDKGDGKIYSFNIACDALLKKKQYLELRTKSGSILGTKKLPGQYSRRRLPDITTSAASYRVINPDKTNDGHNSAADPVVDTLTVSTSRSMTLKDLKNGNIIPAVKTRYSLRDDRYHDATGNNEAQKIKYAFKGISFLSPQELTETQPVTRENNGHPLLLGTDSASFYS